MNNGLWVNLLGILTAFFPAVGLANESLGATNLLSHIPPTLSTKDKIVVSVPADNLTQARVLQSTNSGVKIVAMDLSQGDFRAEVIEHELPLFKYRIQAKDADGQWIETGDYLVERSTPQSESENIVDKLDIEFEENLSKLKQLEGSLRVLKSVPAENLAKNRVKEIERANNFLQDKEAELKVLLDQIEKSKEVNPQDTKGALVTVQRKELELEARGLLDGELPK